MGRLSVSPPVTQDRHWPVPFCPAVPWGGRSVRRDDPSTMPPYSRLQHEATVPDTDGQAGQGRPPPGQSVSERLSLHSCSRPHLACRTCRARREPGGRWRSDHTPRHTAPWMGHEQHVTHRPPPPAGTRRPAARVSGGTSRCNPRAVPRDARARSGRERACAACAGHFRAGCGWGRRVAASRGPPGPLPAPSAPAAPCCFIWTCQGGFSRRPPFVATRLAAGSTRGGGRGELSPLEPPQVASEDRQVVRNRE